MANASKRKGDAWERLVVRMLRAAGFSQAARLRQTGEHDEGDVGGLAWFAVECKDDKSLSPYQMCVQADREAVAASKPYGVVVRKSPRRVPEDAVVMMSWEAFVRLAKYLEEV